MQFCRISDCQRGRAERIFSSMGGLGSMVEIYSNASALLLFAAARYI